jgi:hypothetical protein
MNKEIRPTDTFLIRKEDNVCILTINRVHSSHKGKYEFIAVNKYGQTNGTVEIEVQGYSILIFKNQHKILITLIFINI